VKVIIPVRMGFVVCMRGFGWLAVFEDVDFGAGDAAAVDFFDFERGSEAESCRGVVKDLWVKASVEKSSEKHIATDAGEAVEVGDAHGGYCFMAGWRSLLCSQILVDKDSQGSRIPAVSHPLIFRRD
jgi:hypothetical protein